MVGTTTGSLDAVALAATIRGTGRVRRSLEANARVIMFHDRGLGDVLDEVATIPATE